MLGINPTNNNDGSVCTVIVTHNSEQVIDACMTSLMAQTVKPSEVIIVDSGSADTDYLVQYEKLDFCTVNRSANIGFGAANNVGIKMLSHAADFILLINPDTILAPECIEKCLSAMINQPGAAVVSGVLQGYDFKTRQPTEYYDSTGIFRAWYGRWYDRDHNIPISQISREDCEVPAICGALMFCRIAAIVPELPTLFDESFFLYKEDIELSIRLRKRGWTLIFARNITAFHGRGWAAKRNNIDRQLRLLAARNEIRLYVKHPSVYIIWAIAKYGLVKIFNV